MPRLLVQVLFLIVAFPCAVPGAQLPAGYPPLDSETARLLARAGVKQSAGDLKGALADYSEAIEQTQSPHPSAYTDRGVLRMNSGDPTRALADFERAIALAPTADLPRSLRATLWGRLGETTKALAEFDALVALRPPSRLGYWGRGDLRQELGDYYGAISDYTAILGAEPIHAKLFVNRGNARSRMGEFAEALKDYDRAIRLDPKDMLAWKNRATSRRHLGQFDGAIADFTEALKLSPYDANLESLRALTKIDAGRPDEALADLEHAVGRFPRQSVLLHARGRAHRAKGNLAAAIADFTTLINRETAKQGEWFRDRADARRAAGDAAGAAADQAEAERAARLQFMLVMVNPERRGALPQLTSVLNLDPSFADAYLERGRIYQKFDRHELALADFAKAIELRPGYAEALSAQVESLRSLPGAQRIPSSGAAAAARQLAAVRKSEPSRLQSAFLQKPMKGDFAGAHADYSEVIRQKPTEASAYLRRGTMALMLERYGDAIADFDRVVELKPIAPTVSMALTLRGVARQARGEWEAAVSDFDRSFATVADFPVKNRFFRRHVLPRLGRSDSGGSLDSVEARIDPVWISLLGAFLEGKVSEDELLRGIGTGDATAVARRSCAAYYHLGMTYLTRGDRNRAREFLQRAVAVDLKLGLASEERLAECVLARAELARLAAP